MDKKRLPPLPEPLSYVWFAFVDLQATRDRGMAVGPITWSEIQAYDAATLACLSAFDKALIRRCDDASQAVRLGIKTKPTDVKSIKATLRAAIAARKARQAQETKE